MENIFELIEQADELLKNDKNVNHEIIANIKNQISNDSYIGIAQINTIAGNLEYNAKKIAKYIKFATNIGLKSVVFPELALIGYSLDDTINRYPFIINENIKWLNGLAKLTSNTTVFVGFLELNCKDASKKYYNSIAVLQNGKIQKIIRKSTDITPYNRYGISIGDDCVLNDELMQQTEFSDKNTNLLINSSASPSRKTKDQLKHHKLSDISKKYQIPLIYVNQTGATDNNSFDGGSRVYDENGTLICLAKSFEEQFLIVNPYKKIGKIYNSVNYTDILPEKQNEFTLNYESDLERTYKTIVQGIKDYFNKCGLKRAVLGLSGGLDSTVCAVLMVDAIGKENVYGISMPSYITSKESKSDAEMLANNLGIHFTEAPIKEIINTTSSCLSGLFETVEKNWNFRYKKSFTSDNIQARSRATFLWCLSNEFSSCIPIATSDKSEAYMGYATINGDMTGGFAPIADITKTKLFALAKWLNKNRKEKNCIPESVIMKKPGAELAIDPNTGKPLIAEDALMPYEFLDEIIWRIENKNESYDELVNHKFVYEKYHNISKEQKIEWLDKFYKRMSTALYKWSILPPSIIVENHTINKSEYSQPITSCGINYKCVDEKYITESLA